MHNLWVAILSLTIALLSTSAMASEAGQSGTTGVAIVGAVIGILGFLLSCISLWRSVQTARQANAVALAQEKQKWLSNITEAQIGVMAQQRELNSVRFDALRLGEESIARDAGDFSDGCIRQLQTLEKLRAVSIVEMEKASTHADLIKVVGEYIPILEAQFNPKLIEEETKKFTEVAKQRFRIIEDANAKGLDWKKLM
jgi:hypothetical protein